MFPRQGEMGENTPFVSKVDKRSVNKLGTDWMVTTINCFAPLTEQLAPYAQLLNCFFGVKIWCKPVYKIDPWWKKNFYRIGLRVGMIINWMTMPKHNILKSS